MNPSSFNCKLCKKESNYQPEYVTHRNHQLNHFCSNKCYAIFVNAMSGMEVLNANIDDKRQGTPSPSDSLLKSVLRKSASLTQSLNDAGASSSSDDRLGTLYTQSVYPKTPKKPPSPLSPKAPSQHLKRQIGEEFLNKEGMELSDDEGKS
jgi:hypothetical protein